MARSPSGTPFSRAARSIWPVALVLAASAVAAPLGLDWSGAHWATVSYAVVGFVVLSLLVWLRAQHSAALRALARRDEEIRRKDEELLRRDAEWRSNTAQNASLLREEAGHLLRTRLPAALAGGDVPPARHEGLLDEALLRDFDRVLVEAGAAQEASREHQESLRLVVVALARRVQTSAHRIQETVSVMAERHAGDADVLESSMRVDHAAAQQGRHAQSLAVLCGEWPGQQWQKPLALVDAVRAGSARILAYQRVEVSGDPDIAAAAQVVEPIIHLVAELLANATQSSPPAISVSVAVRTVQRGAVIEIDDGGVGMDEHTLERAREVVSGRRLLNVGDVGEIPQTGLAVVGRYARKHGFQADLLPSPYGGVRAVVLVPADVLEVLDPVDNPSARTLPPSAEGLGHGYGAAGTGARAASPPASVPPPAAAPEPAATADERPPSCEPVPGSGSAAPELAPSGLPQRRSSRGRTPRHAAPPPPPVTAELPPQTTPEQAGAWMGALFEGCRAGQQPDSGRPVDDSPSTPPSDSEGQV